MNESKIRDQRFWKSWRKSGALGTLSFDEQQHPELQPGEVFITNSDASDFHEIGWHTKRVGIVALDNLGRPIGQRAWPGSFPVFAQKSELAAKGVVISRQRESIRYYEPTY